MTPPIATSTALILFAHGARDPEWAAPIQRVQAAVRALLPAQRVELAFLEFMAPNLADCVSQLVGQGVRRISVVPMFIAQGGHLKRDVPELLARLGERYPDVSFGLSPPVGENAAVIEAMAAAACATLQN